MHRGQKPPPRFSPTPRASPATTKTTHKTEKPLLVATATTQKDWATTTVEALTALDPWWNPPWPYTWHRTWQQYRATISGNDTLSDTLQRWANAQRSQRSTLHPSQQQLLTTASFTAGWSSSDVRS